MPVLRPFFPYLVQGWLQSKRSLEPGSNLDCRQTTRGSKLTCEVHCRHSKARIHDAGESVQEAPDLFNLPSGVRICGTRVRTFRMGRKSIKPCMYMPNLLSVNTLSVWYWQQRAWNLARLSDGAYMAPNQCVICYDAMNPAAIHAG